MVEKALGLPLRICLDDPLIPLGVPYAIDRKLSPVLLPQNSGRRQSQEMAIAAAMILTSPYTVWHVWNLRSRLNSKGSPLKYCAGWKCKNQIAPRLTGIAF